MSDPLDVQIFQAHARCPVADAVLPEFWGLPIDYDPFTAEQERWASPEHLAERARIDAEFENRMRLANEHPDCYPW